MGLTYGIDIAGLAFAFSVVQRKSTLLGRGVLMHVLTCSRAQAFLQVIPNEDIGRTETLNISY